MDETKVRSIFNVADVPILKLWELPNQYWPRPVLEKGREDEFIRYQKLREESPWWLVRTPYGMVELGRRKRVISIDWSDTGLAAEDLTQDSTTKSEYLVHAWSELDAIRYLTALGLRLLDRDSKVLK